MHDLRHSGRDWCMRSNPVKYFFRSKNVLFHDPACLLRQSLFQTAYFMFLSKWGFFRPSKKEEERRQLFFNHHAKTALLAATWKVVWYDKWKRNAIFNQLTLGFCFASITLSSKTFLSSKYTHFRRVHVF